MDELIQTFVLMWAVIDPIGTVPVFIAVTRRHDPGQLPRIACRAVAIAALILVFFIVAGQILLEAMDIPLSAFQIAGGIVLFIFSLTMIFGESKPEEEIDMLQRSGETAVFPLAVPSIASPGAMMAVVLLTDNHRFSIFHQMQTTGVILAVLAIQLLLLLLARRILRVIGESGASVVSRIMGLILASVAVTSVLNGIRGFFAF
ncbi:MAG: MarC family protein [PVC group bacterium]